MNEMAEGIGIVYCEGAYQSTYGKTAHGLVRKTRRYDICGVVDSKCAGEDSGAILDGTPNGISVFEGITAAYKAAAASNRRPTHLIVGLAPDGGRMEPELKRDLLQAIDLGLNVDSGLHDFLSDDPDLVEAAARRSVTLRDVRKPPPRSLLHGFSGKIEEVASWKIAVLGTDSAIGKRTTAWKLVEAFESNNTSVEMIGTGQTAWLQGARYSIVLDSLVNDFVSGEIEHVIWSAWHERNPEVLLIEGQGSLLNPAYPGGFEILAAGRPDCIVLQHAPERREYDGFPGYPIQSLDTQISALELISGKPVAAIAINREGIDGSAIASVCRSLSKDTGLPVFDPLSGDLTDIAGALLDRRSRGV